MKKALFLSVIMFFLAVITMINDEEVKAGVHDIAVPPQKPVKLVFIHHSVGGHWLAHENGGLVEELNANKYYVNDITYGWEPPALTESIVKKMERFVLRVQDKIFKSKKTHTGAYSIGNRTDIGHMPDWFLGPDAKMIMQAVYNENLETSRFGNHSNSTSSKPLQDPDPAMENEIIMFKSCFPNSQLTGNPNDSAASDEQPLIQNFSADSEYHTVANAKRVFNDLLSYFQKHQDKFFVIVTPPPRSELPQDGKIARGFSNWLVHDWMEENDYNANNVMVFDLYNVLTSKNRDGNDAGESTGNHHRIWNGEVQHIVQTDNHELVYPTAPGDEHPSPEGLRKATEEFVPLLNHYYRTWKDY